MAQRKRTTIRVGQRLVRWDGERGHVALNSVGIRIFDDTAAVLINWNDGASEYQRLIDFDGGGITFGRGVMPWAKEGE